MEKTTFLWRPNERQNRVAHLCHASFGHFTGKLREEIMEIHRSVGRNLFILKRNTFWFEGEFISIMYLVVVEWHSRISSWLQLSNNLQLGMLLIAQLLSQLCTFIPFIDHNLCLVRVWYFGSVYSFHNYWYFNCVGNFDQWAKIDRLVQFGPFGTVLLGGRNW